MDSAPQQCAETEGELGARCVGVHHVWPWAVQKTRLPAAPVPHVVHQMSSLCTYLEKGARCGSGPCAALLRADDLLELRLTDAQGALEEGERACATHGARDQQCTYM